MTTIGNEDPSPPLTVADLRQLGWRRLFSYVQRYRWQMAAALAGLLVSSAIGLAFPLIIGEAVGQVLAQGDYALLNRFVLLLLGLFALQALGTFVQTYALGVVGERVIFALRNELYRRLTTLSLAFFGQRRTGELISRLSSDVTLIRSLLTTNIIDFLGASLSLVGTLVIVFLLNPTLTLFLLLLAPVIAGVAVVLGGRLEQRSTTVQDALAQSIVTAEEGLSGIRVVQSFARERYEAERFAAELERATRAATGVALLRAGFEGLLVFLGFGAIAAIIWFAGRQVIAGTMTLPLLTSFLIYGVQIAFGLGQLAGLYAEAREAVGAVRRVFELLDAEPTVQDLPDAVALPAVAGSISFDDVSFSYERGSSVLQNITLTIAPGEVVALVGPSGAGKSTLFNLIPRFYDPTAGAVRVDGHDLRMVTAASVREQVGLVPQETLLFGGSVRENIRYGRLEATEAEIEVAARAANAHDFIAALPQGYDTVVGERGTRLSGGQRQRIAIARALLKNPRILLLDEATSALDTESERLVQAALDRLMQGRTTVVIAHRLSTVVAAHRIVVLDQGRIMELGTHEQLLAQGGLYARLYALQFQSGADDALIQNEAL